MKIFYGVQGTGNGHITRARVMAQALYAAGMTVDFQFTGRPAEQYFDMQIFKNYQVRTGLTFYTEQGRVSYLKTALTAQPMTFWQDIQALDLSAYDLVICDYEPVTAWAAKRQNKPVLGIGHQYAFNYPIPRAGGDPLARLVMNNFAPTTQSLGLHWHHFNQPILPPIIETPVNTQAPIDNKILVYLPFEHTQSVFELLAAFTDYDFHIYTPNVQPSPYPHMHCKALSREGFQQDLRDSVGIMSNAWFELASEALQLGKKILVKPLHQQMEQLSNAAALQQLGYGQVMSQLDKTAVRDWLKLHEAKQISYPHVAQHITQWIQNGLPARDEAWLANIWRTVEVVTVRC